MFNKKLAIYSKSRIYTLIELTIKAIPCKSINWVSITKGKNNIYLENPIPVTIKKINIIKHDIKKLIKPDKFTEIGKISLGKYTFFIIPPLPIMQPSDISIVFIKYIIRINPMSTIIDCYRDILFYQSMPHIKSLLVVLLCSLILCYIGFKIFRKLERGFAEEV